MRPSRPCTVERLEPRTLMSVTPAALMVGDTLVVTGSGSADNGITIDYTDSTKSTVLVKISSTNKAGNPTFMLKTFAASAIQQVFVRGGAGVDNVEIGDDGIAFDKNTWIDCLAGNDTISSNDAAGAKVLVTGSQGSKTIFLGNGDDTVDCGPATVDVVAGDGNNTFVCLAGSQSIAEGSGTDTYIVRSPKAVPAVYNKHKDKLVVEKHDGLVLPKWSLGNVVA